MSDFYDDAGLTWDPAPNRGEAFETMRRRLREGPPIDSRIRSDKDILEVWREKRLQREFTVLPARATRSYRGKRARRQAFYGRLRVARAIERSLSGSMRDWYFERHMGDALVYGLAWAEVSMRDGALQRRRLTREEVQR